jgi:hypothetical protein
LEPNGEAGFISVAKCQFLSGRAGRCWRLKEQENLMADIIADMGTF